MTMLWAKHNAHFASYMMRTGGDHEVLRVIHVANSYTTRVVQMLSGSMDVFRGLVKVKTMNPPDVMDVIRPEAGEYSLKPSSGARWVCWIPRDEIEDDSRAGHMVAKTEVLPFPAPPPQKTGFINVSWGEVEVEGQKFGVGETIRYERAIEVVGVTQDQAIITGIIR